MMKEPCLNGMRDHEGISPLRGLVTIGLNSRLQRLGREAADMCMPGIFLIPDFIHL